MTVDRAIEILRCLANGVDPMTGEILEANHLCNSPEVKRAIHTAIHAMSGADDAKNPRFVRKNGKLNAGRPWTDEDLDALERMYRDGKPMDWICEKLQRRERGVLKQLAYLGLAESGRTSSPGLERAGLRWTREEDTLLRNLYSEKWPIAEIAAEMRRSAYSIYCRMEKLQLFGAEYGYPPHEDLPSMGR